jgi:hypothetical protein
MFIAWNWVRTQETAMHLRLLDLVNCTRKVEKFSGKGKF